MSRRNDEIVPEHESGIETNTEASLILNSVEEAKSFYQKAKQRLLHVNEWHNIAGALSADFQLTDERETR